MPRADPESTGSFAQQYREELANEASDVEFEEEDTPVWREHQPQASRPSMPRRSHSAPSMPHQAASSGEAMSYPIDPIGPDVRYEGPRFPPQPWTRAPSRDRSATAEDYFSAEEYSDVQAPTFSRERWSPPPPYETQGSEAILQPDDRAHDHEGRWGEEWTDIKGEPGTETMQESYADDASQRFGQSSSQEHRQERALPEYVGEAADALSEFESESEAEWSRSESEIGLNTIPEEDEGEDGDSIGEGWVDAAGDLIEEDGEWDDEDEWYDDEDEGE